MPKWSTSPEMLTTFVLFLLSVLGSIYSPDLRRFFALPSRKLKDFQIERLRYRITLLTRLHENTYRLFLFFLWHTSGLAVYAAIISTITVLTLEFVNVYTKLANPMSVMFSVWMNLAGLTVSRLWDLHWTAIGLYKFEDTIGQLKLKLAALHPPPSILENIKLVEQEVAARTSK